MTPTTHEPVVTRYYLNPDRHGPTQLPIVLSVSDAQRIKRGRWSAIVTNQTTHQRVKLTGASCGCAGCMCAMRMRVVPHTEQKERP